MSYQMPPTGGPPRSTPIPGQSTPIPGTGPAPYQGVPTPGVFLGTQDTDTPPPVKVKKDRNFGFWILVALVFVPTAIGIGAAIWGVLAAKDAVDNANDQINNISIPGNDDPGVNQLLAGGPAASVAALENGIPGDPTNFVQIILYPGYAFGTAQDPVQPDHLDEYMLQDGTLGAPSPQTNDPDAPNNVFTIRDVQWAAIAAVAADAPRLASVEEGDVTHIIVDRDVFSDAHAVIVRIYISGPRGSAFIEVQPDGTIIRVV